MKRFVLALFTVVAVMSGALADPPSSSVPVSVLGLYTPLAVTSTSSNAAIPVPSFATPAQSSLTLYNDGSKSLYFKQGGLTVTATTADTLLPAGASVTVWASGSYIAAVAGSGDVTTLRIYQSNGPINFNIAGSGGGGGGLPANAATATNQATQITAEQTTATNTTGVATAANQATANTTLSTIATNTTGAATATAQASQLAQETTTATNTGSGGTLAFGGGGGAQLVTRPNNTTTYTANTGWNTATSASSPGYLTFVTFCRANSGYVLLTDILVTDSANQTVKLTGTLWIFDAAPTTVINDNATFSISSTDLSHLKALVPFTTATVSNQGSGSAGSTVDEETNLGREFKCASGDTAVYGMVQVTNAYVPTASEVLTFTPRTVGVN